MILQKRYKRVWLSLILFMLGGIVMAYAEETARELRLEDMIARILQNYPTVTLASLEIEKSQQELHKVESQLGWIFGAQTGIGHDVTFIDAPTDRFDVGANLGRRYESGIKFDINGGYIYEDSSASFSPLAPNPSERVNLDLKWRIPFGRGEDYPEYQQGKILAESALESQKANQIYVVDNLVTQAINIYYDAAETYMRILDAEKAIDRAKKLQFFVEKNKSLGLAEKKDLLIVQAQIDRLVAARDNLYIAWSRQKAEINRLTGQSVSTGFTPSSAYDDIAELDDKTTLLALIYDRDPQVQFQQARMKSAEANITLAKNKKEEQLDVVLSVGARAAQGDTAAGSVNSEEWAGQARLEYLYEMDKRGFDAEIYQAMLDKRLAEEQLTKVKHDAAYSAESLMQQITDNKNALVSNKKRYEIEAQKMQDALQRYREGRADTREIIEFENDLFASSLVYENQKLQLARTYATLNLLIGRIWQPGILEERQIQIRNQPQ